MVEVIVKSDESFESALKRFKRKCQMEGILTEIRKREFYEKPSERRKKKEEEGRRRINQRQKKLTLDHRLVADAGLDLERPVLDVGLDRRVVELAADQPLGVEHGVDRVNRDLRLGGVADQALAVVEGDDGRRRAVALVVGDDLHALVLPHAHARVGRAKVNADSNATLMRVRRLTGF